jgi:radical SAM superfamily enzyme YgiQ (UPF0313 family)
MRFMSPERAIREIEDAVHRIPFFQRVFFSDDDLFARSRESLADLCALYKERIGLPFRCEGSPRTLTREKLDLLLDAGLRSIEVGIQSGSERVRREIYQRSDTDEEILRAARLLHDAAGSHGLKTDYDVLVHSPYETQEDRQATPLFVSRLPRPFRLNVFGLIPYPGTALRERAVQDGVLSQDPVLYNRNYVDLFRSDLTWLTTLLLLQSQMPALARPSWIRWGVSLARWRILDRACGVAGWVLGEVLLPLAFSLWMLKGWFKRKVEWRGRSAETS